MVNNLIEKDSASQDDAQSLNEEHGKDEHILI